MHVRAGLVWRQRTHTHARTLICMFVCMFVLSASLFILQLFVVSVVLLLLLAIAFLSFSFIVFVVAARLSFCLRFGRQCAVSCCCYFVSFAVSLSLSLSLALFAPCLCRSVSLPCLAQQLIVRNISDCALCVSNVDQHRRTASARSMVSDPSQRPPECPQPSTVWPALYTAAHIVMILCPCPQPHFHTHAN